MGVQIIDIPNVICQCGNTFTAGISMSKDDHYYVQYVNRKLYGRMRAQYISRAKVSEYSRRDALHELFMPIATQGQCPSCMQRSDRLERGECLECGKKLSIFDKFFGHKECSTHRK